MYTLTIISTINRLLLGFVLISITLYTYAFNVQINDSKAASDTLNNNTKNYYDIQPASPPSNFIRAVILNDFGR